MLIARRAGADIDGQDSPAGGLKMTIADFLKEPLEGKTSLSRVIWLYG